MGLSLLGQLGGRGKWGNFIAQWVPTILIMAVYNKLVKLEGHDKRDRGRVGAQRRHFKPVARRGASPAGEFAAARRRAEHGDLERGASPVSPASQGARHADSFAR
jgi:hypothetical protein